MPSKKSVGFIGTGLMGAPMVRRLLQADFAVTIWNRSAEKSAALVASGASIADSPATVAQQADIVCLCVTDTAAVEAVVFGDAGVASTARDNSILVDFSSISPDATRTMAKRLVDQSNMHWVDAPVSGGVKGATDGTLIIMYGGEDGVVSRVDSLFKALSSRSTHMGGSGTGQVTKLCNQIIVASNLLAISESLLLGQEAGIRTDRLPDALRGGWADSLPLQIIGPTIAGANPEKAIGALSNMLKDIQSALVTAGAVSGTMPITCEAILTYKKACTTLGIDADISELGAFYGIEKK
tara:strand:- start:1447 stop:2334 length:888 start_codon:yes stop_codon:yes gene_type:complete